MDNSTCLVGPPPPPPQSSTVVVVVGMRMLLSWVWLECMCCCHGYSWNACLVVMGVVGMCVICRWCHWNVCVCV